VSQEVGEALVRYLWNAGLSAFLRPWIRLQGVPTSPSAPLYRMIERHDDG